MIPDLAKERRGWSGPVMVGLVATVIGLALALKVLLPAGGDASALASFGKEEPSTLAYAEARLGDVTARDSIGHDGRFFFIQANDPLLLEPAVNAAVLDRPTYRTQRMLYPLLAGLGGLAPPSVVVWGLLAVNLLAMGGGAAVLARYAQIQGMSPWFGLAFPLNPGLMSELTIDGAGVLAFALACAAVLAVRREHTAWAMALLALSALTREVMLMAAFGIALWLWRRGRKQAAWLHAAVPVAVVLTWGAYVRLRIPGAEAAEVQEIGMPFVGLVGAFGTWLDEPAHLAVGGAVFLCLVLFISHLVRGRSDLLAYAAVGFVVVAVLLTRQVWEASFDMTRAVAPVLTALILNPFLFARRSAAPLPST